MFFFWVSPSLCLSFGSTYKSVGRRALTEGDRSFHTHQRSKLLWVFFLFGELLILFLFFLASWGLVSFCLLLLFHFVFVCFGVGCCGIGYFGVLHQLWLVFLCQFHNCPCLVVVVVVVEKIEVGREQELLCVELDRCCCCCCGSSSGPEGRWPLGRE